MLPNSPERFFAPSRLKQSQAAQNAGAILSSNSQLPQLDAVIIRNLTYEVGRGSRKKRILNEINLTVPEGSIYGLLGPSGCGKTTMLKCVVGRIWPKSGSVLVFGCRPTDGQGQVPGRHVGYMPQEISIYEDFTIEETLVYFGKINRMHSSEIRRRIDFLVHFLDLPSRRRTVTNLSGGQKRRVSLAAALVHSPPLLILDEPTVGVDPLLRQNIWQHLVTLTKTERISVIITTHYIEEARLANVVGLMRNGKILAEDSPNDLMHKHELSNLEDVFLKLCVTDSSLVRQLSQAKRAGAGKRPAIAQTTYSKELDSNEEGAANRTQPSGFESHQLCADIMTRPTSWASEKARPAAQITINTATNRIEVKGGAQIEEDGGHVNEAVENFSSEDDEEDVARKVAPLDGHSSQLLRFRNGRPDEQVGESRASFRRKGASELETTEEYLAVQAMQWAARRSNALSMAKMGLAADRGPYDGLDGRRRKSTRSGRILSDDLDNSNELAQWLKTLMAVTWKNYVRLRRNPPVLVFQFMLPAIQVILFCLCIGGEPFDVPVAVVNEEAVPKASLQFLNGLNKKIIRQVQYDNLTSAIEAVRRGKVWGAIHIPDRYSENLQSRLIMGEEVSNETISNGTIRVYPDLTNLHLALALETSFRETYLNFARESIGEMGYDKSLADLPIQMGKPIYGTLRKDGYLEFMAPGVVISICYVMATGLTALAFILERRDGLLERSLVSGVQTSQILLAHAINQVFVMIIQIFLVLGCTFFIFEIPSRGPFFWVVLLILLQGCTGMAFGLLVSAICAEENTAVMMVVGTFYTNLILAGIIWPIEAMPHWLRPLSYAQPQTLPTDSLRHILSRGWGLLEPGVALGFAVTLGWLAVFLIAAGVIFKYTP